MNGLEAQQQVEALSGDWAHYWQKPRCENALKISIVCAVRISIEHVAKIGIEYVINIVLCVL
jgi:hypothetical protein